MLLNSNKLHQIKQALLAVNNGMSLSKAAAKFGCCKSTLHIHLKRAKYTTNPPMETYTLSKTEEERLGNWLVYCHYMGYFQLSPLDVRREAQTFMQLRGTKKLYNSEWCKEFTRKQLFVKKSMELYEKCRYWNSKFQNKWLGCLIIYCRNQELFHCLQDPRYMYYFCQLHIVDNLKVILAYSAQGKMAPPLVINTNLNQSTEFEELIVPNDWFAFNCREWSNLKTMDNPLKYYIEQVLKPHLIQEDINKPILLFHKCEPTPLRMVFYENCTEHEIYPVNCPISEFKLHQNLQMEISGRIKSVLDRQISNYVDVVKNILIFKLTKPRMCESFRASGIYPLAVGKMDVTELPRLQMHSTVESVKAAEQLRSDVGKNSILGKQFKSAKSTTLSRNRRKINEPKDNPDSVELQTNENSGIEPPSEKRLSSISLGIDKYDQMAFQNFCLDDDDIVVCNEPLDDP